MLNLIRKSKIAEDKLTIGIVNIIKMLKHKHLIKNNFRHIWYDFHHETHGDRFHKIDDLMNEINGAQTEFGYFMR